MKKEPNSKHKTGNTFAFLLDIINLQDKFRLQKSAFSFFFLHFIALIELIVNCTQQQWWSVADYI